MNPFSPRSVAAHRDACDEEEARKDAEACERDHVREALDDRIRAAVPHVYTVWEFAEDVGLDPDEAIEALMDRVDQLRARPATPDHDKEPPHA